VATGVFVLVLASALAHSAWNAQLKGRDGDPFVRTAGLAAVWAVVGLPIAIAMLAPLPSGESLPYLLASVVVHLGHLALLTAAYGLGDLTFVYPIARGLPPLLVAVTTSLATEERLGVLGWVGVLAIAGGVLAIAFAPSRRSPTARSGRAVAYAVATAVTIALYTVIDGIGTRASHAPFGYAAWLVTLEGIVFVALALGLRGRSLAVEIWHRRTSALGAGVLSGSGYAIALFATTLAPIALVAALRETAVIFAAPFGVTVLREPVGRRRIAAAVLVAVGAVAVRMGG
jgi:drug/metabolite transporter (DMT)-like permease